MKDFGLDLKHPRCKRGYTTKSSWNLSLGFSAHEDIALPLCYRGKRFFTEFFKVLYLLMQHKISKDYIIFSPICFTPLARDSPLASCVKGPGFKSNVEFWANCLLLAKSQAMVFLNLRVKNQCSKDSSQSLWSFI